MAGPLDDEAKRLRNIAILAHVGGFVFPLVGLGISVVFYVQKQQRLAWSVLAASLLGAVFWALVIGG